MAYCKNCINAVESNLPEGGLYCTMFRSLCGDTIGCSNGVDGKRKAKTNADRIRAMTDEGLATYHAKLVGCPKNVVDYRGCNAALECKASACWLDWLKQEAEE